MINNKKINFKDEIIDEYIKLSIKNIDNIYKKENPYIFKFPYSICSLDNTKDQENIYKLYCDFLNLDLKKQIEILSDNKYLKKS